MHACVHIYCIHEYLHNFVLDIMLYVHYHYGLDTSYQSLVNAFDYKRSFQKNMAPITLSFMPLR
eukprot:c29969_g1_i1 orf=26-217(+)